MGNEMRKAEGFTLIELLIVVAIIGLLAIIAIPLMLNAIDRSRQSITVQRIQKIGSYVERYIIDHSKIGCPKVGDDIFALQRIFEETEIDFNKFLTRDGWNYPVIIDMNAAIGDKRYTVQSYGSDGHPGPDPATVGIVKIFDEDIIWTAGRFIQLPEGAQTSR